VTTHAAVGVDDDLAPGQTRVAQRTTDHETPGRVDVYLDVLVHHAFGQDRHDDLVGDNLSDLSL
jgi:hypothetical protein